MIEETILGPHHTPETDAILAEADRLFQSGQRSLRQGDAGNARRMFDRAIDVLLEAAEELPDRQRAEQRCEQLAAAINALEIQELGGAGRASGYQESPLDGLLAITFPVDPNLEMNAVEVLRLPVSELPLEVNSEVMKYIRYFSTTGGRKTLVQGLVRLGRYRPMIQRILREEGVPQELMYLAMAESGYQARALSRKRAAGMWQFMSSRGVQYGLKRSADYDERLDPVKATRAAARHLRDLYVQLGDWYLAIAAYNAGPGRIDQAVRRTGYADFWEFHRRRALPAETIRYVPLILATIIMAKNPAEYGLESVVADPPLEYNAIEVSAATHLGLIADVLGRPLDELRDMNPAVLRDVVPAGHTAYVPKGAGVFVTAAVETVPEDRRASWRVHRVGDGESIAEIARLYRTTAEQIAVANGGATVPEAGNLMVIPVSYTPANTVPEVGSARKKRNSVKSAPRRRAAFAVQTGG